MEFEDWSWFTGLLSFIMGFVSNSNALKITSVILIVISCIFLIFKLNKKEDKNE